jgi:hypothetical protein
MNNPLAVRPHLDELFAKLDPAKPARLVFAVDATASRQPTWEMATKLTAEMFQAAGGLELQLVFYRAEREFVASRWMSGATSLAAAMSCVRCDAGPTQINRVLRHARNENRRQKVAALILVSDAVEELPEALYASAREMSVPTFLFQEGTDERVASVYRAIAEITGGASCRFDSGAAARLRELLRAVAAFASGGRKALANENTAAAQLLLAQLK